MTNARSEIVPEVMRPAYEAIVARLDPFCAQHLNAEYATLCRELAAALARKRSSPLTRGKPEIWACGIVYALARSTFYLTNRRRPLCALTSCAWPLA